MSALDRESIIAAKRGERILVVGLGAIGSWVGRWLDANGMAWVGYDDDKVELKNLAAAAYSTDDIGRLKGDVFRKYTYRWTTSDTAREAAYLSCADHGLTRRDMAARATFHNIPFFCAKANGGEHQIWTVRTELELMDFCAFDEAAEANPVTVPCGASSVGRAASIAAAAGILSAWLDIDVTADEVEKSYGETFDPAILYAIPARWENVRGDAIADADAMASNAWDESIKRARAASDETALMALRAVRRERRDARRLMRSTIHERAKVYVDNGADVKSAAADSVGRSSVLRRPLAQLKQTEQRIAARAAHTELSVPGSIQIVEMSA